MSFRMKNLKTVTRVKMLHLYNKAFHSFVYIYILAIAGQTAGPDWRKIFEGTHGYPRGSH